tara:strand:+ start:1690 stop:2229 length:540 start_codon:yes stop_codon:yes gene_type:complete
MTLFGFTILTGILLGALGIFFILNPGVTRSIATGFLRSMPTAYLTMIAAAAWFIFRHVKNLSQADFGEYKFLIGGITILLLVLAFKFLPDFLAVRGCATLVLFYSREALDAAFLQEPSSRLFLVAIIYIALSIALYLAAWPYRLRDFFNWLYSSSIRSRILGCLMLVYGTILGFVALGY